MPRRTELGEFEQRIRDNARDRLRKKWEEDHFGDYEEDRLEEEVDFIMTELADRVFDLVKDGVSW